MAKSMSKNMRKSKKEPLIKKHGAMVLAIAKAPKKYRTKLIKDAPNHVIKCICECCHNLLKGNVILTSDQKRKLYPKREHLRQLASKSISVKNKKKIINQTGGLLPFLLPLLPLIGKAVLGGAVGAGARAGIRALVK